MANTVKTNPEELLPYLEDAAHFKGFAERLIIPENEQDISEILHVHNEKKIPITIAGGRTGLTGASIPEGGSVLVTERLNKIKTIGSDFAIAEPGVTLSRLFEATEAKKLLYPPDPGERKAFLGGTVATNASGPRAFKYGTTRKWIRRLRLVLSTGDIIDIPRGRFLADGAGQIQIPLASGAVKTVHVPFYNPPVSKNVVGYAGHPGVDLIDLVIGSEGTLGVTTEIEVGLLPLPKNTVTFVIFFGTESDAWQFTKEARKISSIPPIHPDLRISARSIEYFDEGALNFLRSEYAHIPKPAKAAIYLEQEFEDDKRELVVNWFNLIRACRGFAADTWMASREDDREEFREFRYTLPVQVNEWLRVHGQQKIGTDIAVPHEKFAALINFQKEALASAGIRYVTFGHIGDSHVHLNMLPENRQETLMAKRLYLNFMRDAVNLGGTVSAEHGIGKLKRKYFQMMIPPETIRDMERFKKEMDPHLILNRGNLFE